MVVVYESTMYFKIGQEEYESTMCFRDGQEAREFPGWGGVGG